MYDIKTDTYTEDFLIDIVPVVVSVSKIPWITEQKIDGSISVDGIMTTDNTDPYTVSTDYNPAHKKYVDDAIEDLRDDLTD